MNTNHNTESREYFIIDKRTKKQTLVRLPEAEVPTMQHFLKDFKVLHSTIDRKKAIQKMVNGIQPKHWNAKLYEDALAHVTYLRNNPKIEKELSVHFLDGDAVTILSRVKPALENLSKFSKAFIQIRRGILVNMKSVTDFNEEKLQVTLSTGETLPVGEHYVESLHNLKDVILD